MSILTVKTVKDAELYNSLQQKHSMVVMFYRDNCGHCSTFKPIFKGKFSEYMEETYPDTKLVMIDVLSEGYQHIQGFGKDILGVPTIMYFTREQANKIEYDPPGERTFDNIREFVDRIGRVDAAQSGGKRRMRTRSHHHKKKKMRTIRRKSNKNRKTNKKTNKKNRKTNRKTRSKKH